jgi:WD40 repeat protein
MGSGSLAVSGSTFTHNRALGGANAAAGADATVRLWDTDTGHQTQVLQLRKMGQAAAFSPDGRRLASGNVAGTVKVWDTDTGQELLTIKAHAKPVISVALARTAAASLRPVRMKR